MQEKAGEFSKKMYMILSNYSIKHLENKDKVRFYYALKGRDGKSGILKLTGTVHLAKSVLLTPIEFEKDIKKFFSSWHITSTVRNVIVTDKETLEL